MTFKPSHALALLLPLLAACGGGGGEGESKEYQAAVTRANAKQDQAQTLGADSPCTSAAQCGHLTFLSPTSPCSSYSYKPYSLVATSAAAASAAAAEQRELAGKALQLAPSSGTACAAFVNPAPPLACRASACQVL